MLIPEPHKQWYVLHVLSGQENKVRERIIRLAQEQEFSSSIFRVEVPTELVSDVVKGVKRETKHKLYPGYVYINMELIAPDGELNKDLWYFIQAVEGVITINGVRTAPVPLRAKEIEPILAIIDNADQVARPKVEFEVGDSVRVTDGPFKDQEAVVEEVDPEHGKMRVSVTIFGQNTPVDLEYWQAAKA